MNRAFFLIEVLISIVLISGVILTLFKIKENNLNFLDKYYSSNSFSSFISIFALNNTKIENKNSTVYLNDIIEFKDDTIRKKIKSVKAKIDEDKLDNKEIKSEDFTINIDTYESKYIIDNEVQRTVYTVKLN